jgi:hypothetical protein
MYVCVHIYIESERERASRFASRVRFRQHTHIFFFNICVFLCFYIERWRRREFKIRLDMWDWSTRMRLGWTLSNITRGTGDKSRRMRLGFVKKKSWVRSHLESRAVKRIFNAWGKKIKKNTKKEMN